MSQIYKTSTGSPLPPEVATSYVTDDGTSIASGNIENVKGVDSTENNANGVLTRANPNLSNNLQVILTNRLQGTATSTNASNADMVTFSLAATPTVYRFYFDATGRDTGSGDGVGYTLYGSARTDGASATIIATPFIDTDEDASLIGASINLLASANSIVLRGIGVAGRTVNFSAVGTYVQV